MENSRASVFMRVNTNLSHLVNAISIRQIISHYSVGFDTFVINWMQYVTYGGVDTFPFKQNDTKTQLQFNCCIRDWRYPQCSVEITSWIFEYFKSLSNQSLIWGEQRSMLIWWEKTVSFIQPLIKTYIYYL